MKKPYLLIAGDDFYPSGTEDWVGFFETYEEAYSLVKLEIKEELFTKGPRKGQVRRAYEVPFIQGRKCDWYEIVNVEQWAVNHPFQEDPKPLN